MIRALVQFGLSLIALAFLIPIVAVMGFVGWALLFP